MLGGRWLRLPWVLWLVSVIMVVVAVTLAWRIRGDFSWGYFFGIGAVVPVSFGAVGAVVNARYPRHPIGWIFAGTSFVTALSALATGYGQYSFSIAPDALPGAIWLRWSTSFLWAFAVFPPVTLLPLLFPSGRLPTGRWHPVVWLSALGLVPIIVGNALHPDAAAPLANPIHIPVSLAVLDSMTFGGFLMDVGCMAAAVTSLVVRFRRARGDERQQIKWLVFVVVLLALAVALPLGDEVQSFLYTIVYPCFPVAIGIAILKYRLYDIDVIINRALVYGILSGALLAIYFGTVVALQALLRPFVGANSELATVATTLLIAALFQPLRQRIQGIIDRRFFRRKYNAAQTLAAFSARLRDETNLHIITEDMLGVVEETLQPAHASVWLREAGAER